MGTRCSANTIRGVTLSPAGTNLCYKFEIIRLESGLNSFWQFGTSFGWTSVDGPKQPMELDIKFLLSSFNFGPWTIRSDTGSGVEQKYISFVPKTFWSIELKAKVLPLAFV